jgi:hypothetical protein
MRFEPVGVRSRVSACKTNCRRVSGRLARVVEFHPATTIRMDEMTGN